MCGGEGLLFDLVGLLPEEVGLHTCVEGGNQVLIWQRGGPRLLKGWASHMCG